MIEPIRQPKIDAPTPEGQIKQIKGFLYSLVEHLNMELSHLEKSTETENTAHKGG